jgi:hypothetical protein
MLKFVQDVVYRAYTHDRLQREINANIKIFTVQFLVST